MVRNERRQGEGAPYGIVDEEVFHQLFPKTHPYYAAVIGSHSDIESARLEDVREFFKESEGTVNRSADEIAGESALLGTDLAITSDADSAQLSVTVLSRNIVKGLALMADSTQHPTFPDAELERVRANRSAALLQEEDDPVQIAFRAGAMNLFGKGNPYGYDELGTSASLRTIKRDQVEQLSTRVITDRRAAC